jgi:hypothetical protein
MRKKLLINPSISEACHDKLYVLNRKTRLTIIISQLVLKMILNRVVDKGDDDTTEY